jgi:hypothetical protein
MTTFIVTVSPTLRADPADPGFPTAAIVGLATEGRRLNVGALVALRLSERGTTVEPEAVATLVLGADAQVSAAEGASTVPGARAAESCIVRVSVRTWVRLRLGRVTWNVLTFSTETTADGSDAEVEFDRMVATEGSDPTTCTWKAPAVEFDLCWMVTMTCTRSPVRNSPQSEPETGQECIPHLRQPSMCSKCSWLC